MTSPDQALARMQLAAALWSVEGANAAELVDAACDLLVAGHDGVDLAILAGVMRKHADDEAPALLAAALRDVGLEPFEPDAHEAQAIVVRHLAGKVLTGELKPDAFVWRAAWTCPDFAERLVALGEEYLSPNGRPVQQIDADVLGEAHVLASPDGT
ncbi:hypothetical protein OWR29_28695 [Actinoplanes sp. Pm04-4]|uniref:Uncharacterized protein n=1 Tax=Paractinoplanes pyxinae TaxID=2997416 RepID=A0ABT4B687_9ACTN|nr:hypothetical protein [Actinoplanes pyxinae]MCY1141991.1 hypothetical protein [Actinoplanes pyxinae]